MRIAYYADDGTEFETEEECRAYENKLSNLTHELRNGVFAYDHRRNYIDFNNMSIDDFESAFEQISYIKFDNQEAIDAFMEKANEFGFPYFENGINRPLVPGERYFYDDNKDKWFCVEDEQYKLDKIAIVFVTGEESENHD
jgi:hypothetical protein